jgi:predicted anti-sigma-YlaC factor YlaD
MDLIREQLCEPRMIAAYIDGEMSLAEQVVFEKHLDTCPECQTELRLHQQFSCELDSALTSQVEVVIPTDFSRMVAARAISDMGGVRSSAEKKKAVIFCLILAVGGFVLMGGPTRQLTLSLIRRLIGMTVGLVDLVWRAMYDLVLSVGVLSRVVSRKLIVETGNGRTVVVLLALAALLLSRLIVNYHRTSTTD